MRVTVDCLIPQDAVIEGWTEERDQSIKTQIEGFKPVCLSVELPDDATAATKLATLYQNIKYAGAVADHTCGINLYDSNGTLIQRTPNYLLKKRAA